MADENEERLELPPSVFAEQMQRASEELAAQQMNWFERMMPGGPSKDSTFGDLSSMTAEAAVFKTRVQSGGRISIPDAERDALDIGEGDLVQAFVIPLDHSDHDE